MTRVLLAIAAAALTACDTSCGLLAERLCRCDLSRERNRKVCEVARDPDARRRSLDLARQTGVDPERVCRKALAEFRCPE
jgi:hypothetical protein